jgi:hypothetical protein
LRLDRKRPPDDLGRTVSRGSGDRVRTPTSADRHPLFDHGRLLGPSFGSAEGPHVHVIPSRYGCPTPGREMTYGSSFSAQRSGSTRMSHSRATPRAHSRRLAASQPRRLAADGLGTVAVSRSSPSRFPADHRHSFGWPLREQESRIYGEDREWTFLMTRDLLANGVTRLADDPTCRCSSPATY